MEKDKYYTPSLEEFHVGFEFEVLGIDEDKKWHKVTVIETDSLRWAQQYLDDNIYRVKFLDQSDIESLGFVHDNDEPNNYVKGDLNLYHDPIQRRLIIDDADGEVVYFQGTIKNKSELKKVLKQIGYEDLEEKYKGVDFNAMGGYNSPM